MSWSLAALSFGCAGTKPPEVVTATTDPPSTPVVAADPVVQAVPTIGLDVKPESSLVTMTTTDAFVRVRLSGLAPKDERRPPLNLALVVDTSGSMEGAPIERAREACGKLIDAMSDGDVLAIVAFGSRATTLVHATALDAKTRAAAHRAVEGIQAEGTTDMSGGLAAGIVEVQRNLTQDKINRIILMGDGVPNEPTSIPPLAANARDLHVPVTTLGLGADFDETQMTAIATTTGGAFHFVDDASLVATVFRDEILKMQRLSARNVSIALLPGPGATIVETLGVPFAPSGRRAILNIGDIAEGQIRDVVVHLRITPRAVGARLELLDTTASYVPASVNTTLEASQFVGLDVSSDAARVVDATDRDISHQIARLRVANDIVRAIALARAGDTNGARTLLDTTIAFASEAGRRFDDAELLDKAKEAAKLKGTLASLAPQQPITMDRAGPTGVPVPVAPPLSPSAARDLRAMHGESLDVLQGFR